MRNELSHSQILYYNDIATPLGKVTSLGLIHRGTGTDRGAMRVFGSYAIVYFLEGTGEYCDASGIRRQVIPGDLVLVTPDVPHQYSTKPGRYWNECHLIFDGPLFDLCRTQGILNICRPVVHLEPINYWLKRLESVVVSPASQSPMEKTAEVTRLLTLLTEIYTEQGGVHPKGGLQNAITAGRAALDSNIEIEIDPKDVARELGVPYETFRKGFQKQYGVSPVLYRTERRIAAACRLLTLTTMTHQRIAVYLGFSDEFYFSKRFKQVMGISPREYRRQKDTVIPLGEAVP